MYIGKSLSFCISQMIDFNIDPNDVFIISSWNFSNKKEFEESLEKCKDYWRENFDKGKEIALKLYSEGKIYSPKAEGNKPPDLTEGELWTDVAGNKITFSLPEKKFENIRLK